MDDSSFTKTVSFSLPAYLVEALGKMAVQESRSASNMLRVILEERLEAPRGDGHV